MTTDSSLALPDLALLRRFSARVGADPLLTQAAGGNTSIKLDGTMWIKASGTWLMHAETRDIFVPVRLGPLLDGFAADDPACESCTDYVDAGRNPSGLRPSIETSVHAVVPQPVVVHVHSIATIAWAVQHGGEAKLAALLDGLPWAFVPYVRPGLPLARGIVAKLRPEIRVLVLGKHGLVVAGESVEAADALLAEVERRVVRPARQVAVASIEALAALAVESAYRPAGEAEAHALAFDPASLAVAGLGPLYPDHVVFLGAETAILDRDGDITADLHRLSRQASPPKLVIAPGTGVFVASAAPPAADAMARCLADVLARLTPGDRVDPLTASDIDALVNWDAEIYRQKLARTAAAAT